VPFPTLEIPVAERPDFDRWLLSNLQLLVQTAHEAYSSYNVMAFALKCEEFIDGDLSNWWVRRNKDRLQSKVADLSAAELRDKWAAYQTLYAVLRTLCKLMAPCVPFVTETMWQNLRLPTDPESVHLCDFPPADAASVDNGLSLHMAAVQRVCSLGLSARQAAKINVRQPLAELVVRAAESDAQAVTRFADLIADELNVKRVALGAPTSATGWQCLEDRGTQVAISTTITPELKLEGLARDVVRQVQNERKNAKLDLLDKIALHLHTEAPELAQAIEAHRGTIATAVQATEWSAAPLEGAHTATVKIDGHPLTVQLRKV
jgi:isoleucyl-tRNA synthetase